MHFSHFLRGSENVNPRNILGKLCLAFLCEEKCGYIWSHKREGVPQARQPPERSDRPGAGGQGRAGSAAAAGGAGAEPAPLGPAAGAAPGAGRGPGRGRGGAGRGQQQQQRHAVRGAGHQPAGRAAAAGAGADPVRRRRGDPGQTGGAGERDGAERAAHGAVGLGRALCPAGGLVHRRGGHGGAEQGAQRPLLRCPDGAAGPGPRSDCHPLLPSGALADWQEQDSHDIPVILGAAAGTKPW